jgi:cysteinyl-tRNA synthetase
MSITLYNSLTRKKEVFEPLNPPFIGMYVCGPTVYNDVHLGNCRTFVSFDVIYRYLLYKGYKVRYVRNITDVGHLLDDGEDRMSKGARIDQLEPMEVAQRYTVGFHDMMRILNALPPSIEPRATGHIPEQIEMVQSILERGYAYEINGSVYFDVPKFATEHPELYGQLSGKVLEDLQSETRSNLKNQDEKRHPSDFAIWIKASDEHIMRWNAPWSVGFPGWHLECSAMSTKYLGKTFDLHGGGMDLQFPHHENEIAQNFGACACAPARYWLHTNMLLLNGKKMSKSDGNTISPTELFTGDSPHTSKAYSPMMVRFFMLQAHYRSTLDITDEALQAAEKGYNRLMEAMNWLKSTTYTGAEALTADDAAVNELLDQLVADMDDDFNTPKAISRLFGLSPIINNIKNGQTSLNGLSKATFERLQKEALSFVTDVLGLSNENGAADNRDAEIMDGLVNVIIELRKKAREDKNWALSDIIRDRLQTVGVQLKDGKDGTTWSK